LTRHAAEESITMKMTGNTILITGGGSGIGRGLAEAFYALGNQVIIAGRRKQVLEATVKANPGMHALQIDLEDSGGLRSVAAKVVKQFPALNVLINNAGIMRPENLLAQPDDLGDAEMIVATNLLGPIRLTAALLPHLRRQPYSAIMMVSSGLAFVPLALTPTYCASKAAIHSYAQSLRYQAAMAGKAMDILELIPPYVQTELMDGAEDPRAMPLKDFLAEVMGILQAEPEVKEICVENVKRLRFAAQSGAYDAVFSGLNAARFGPQ
jgi:uncharacterized oxidoreductase